jgi:transposase
MLPLSMDLRERIIAAVEAGEGSQHELAERFKVSRDVIKKLVRQKRELGTVEPQLHRCGRKPKVTAKHREQLQALVKRRPDATLKELREALKLDVCLKTIWDALQALKLTYKKADPGRGTGAPRRRRETSHVVPTKSPARSRTAGLSG